MHTPKLRNRDKLMVQVNAYQTSLLFLAWIELSIRSSLASSKESAELGYECKEDREAQTTAVKLA